jgi:hypothetical protein
MRALSCNAVPVARGSDPIVMTGKNEMSLIVQSPKCQSMRSMRDGCESMTHIRIRVRVLVYTRILVNKQRDIRASVIATLGTLSSGSQKILIFGYRTDMSHSAGLDPDFWCLAPCALRSRRVLFMEAQPN